MEIFDCLETLGMDMVLFRYTRSHWVGREYAHADDSWTDSDAATICRDLGYDGGSVADPVDTDSGPGGLVPTRQLYDAKCPGINTDDVRAGVCSFRIQRSNSPLDCVAPEGRFAAVQCSKLRYSIVLMPALKLMSLCT